MKIDFKDEHIDVILDALEVYNRLGLGQIDTALNHCFLDKEQLDINDDRSEAIKNHFFPELERNSSYGIGGCQKKFSIAYEILQTVRQSKALIESGGKVDPYDNRYDEPLTVTDVDLPKVDNIKRYEEFRIRDSAVIEYYNNKDYERMWNKIDEVMDLPKCGKSEIVTYEEDLGTHPGEIVEYYVKCHNVRI
jgi:hypothetical protein